MSNYHNIDLILKTYDKYYMCFFFVLNAFIDIYILYGFRLKTLVSYVSQTFEGKISFN